ncbi:Tyrosine-protein kinase ptk [Meiothermus luteus]|jgi:capsular exopolysaccharide synthesis family protein|uniref:Tyrosine-protein kinase ptk n=1 Tax=Meiothermus luteus TaxID=2026184 RepID=A0A399EXJ2_9DEIN|nr:Wzz/FepE/Etk N-terminal domain-containing protein [Meiothermus luteus]RIH88728.1 Tyrosine-protein kinase ptk [Meiothermus luteus]
MRELPGLIRVDFNELAKQLWRYGWLLLLLCAGVTLAVYFFSRLQTPVYQATARLLAAQPTAFSSGLNSLPVASPLDSQAYREAALSSQVLKETLGGSQGRETLEQFRRRLRVRTVEGRQSSIVILSVRDNDPARAARLANEWADALRRWDDQRVRGSFSRYRVSLEAQLRTVQADLERSANSPERREGLRSLQGSLLRDLDLVRALEQGATGQLSLLDLAEVPLRPVAPRPLLNALLAGMLTLALGVLLFVLREALVRTVRSSEEAMGLTGLQVLGEFPRLLGPGRELPKEAASYLRTYVNRGLMSEDDPKIVAVTSPEAKDGKSSVAIALARAYARTGKRTLLIDLDLHRPVLHEEFGVKSGPDVVSVLRDPLFGVAAHQVERGLSLLPCLQSVDDPSGLLSQQLRPFLRRLREAGEWDTIVIDTPPVLAVTDTLVVAPQVSGVLVVVSVGITSRRGLRVAVDNLTRIGAQVLGLVVNQLRPGEGVLVTSKGYFGRYEAPLRRPNSQEQDPLHTQW